MFDTRPRVAKRNRLPNNPEEKRESKAVAPGRFPSWLHRKLPKGKSQAETTMLMRKKRLFTVCEEARCPNLTECFSKKTATFLALGYQCTRACGFCDVDWSKAPPPLDPNEPNAIAESVIELGLKHVVITMVARDDLSDGGASQIANIIQEVRRQCPGVTVEILTSDFAGNIDAWSTVLDACPDIFNYNIETVRELTPRVRHKATYERTLQFLNFANAFPKRPLVKSGIMLGLGETEEQVEETIEDLKKAGCDIVTIGQYLQPRKNKLPVKAFIHPDQFEAYAQYGRSKGILHMYCGPLVRSSYNADQVHKEIQEKLHNRQGSHELRT
ncbi:MAG: lipoyl synthase [Waddliaceae bacterium]|nr:lipoyl synthase [Waddliaceae bacterium]